MNSLCQIWNGLHNQAHCCCCCFVCFGIVLNCPFWMRLYALHLATQRTAYLPFIYSFFFGVFFIVLFFYLFFFIIQNKMKTFHSTTTSWFVNIAYFSYICIHSINIWWFSSAFKHQYQIHIDCIWIDLIPVPFYFFFFFYFCSNKCVSPTHYYTSAVDGFLYFTKEILSIFMFNVLQHTLLRYTNIGAIITVT